MRVVEPQPGQHVEVVSELPVRLRVQAVEIAPIVRVDQLVGMIRAGAGVFVPGFVDAIAEIGRVLAAIAVQVIDPVGEGSPRGQFGAQVRVHVHIGDADGLAVAVGLQAVTDARIGRVGKGIAAQESAQHVVERARHRDLGGPPAQRAVAIEAHRELVALLVELRARRVVVGMNRKLRVHVGAVAQQQIAGRILRQDRHVGIHVHLRAAQRRAAPVERVVTIELRAVIAQATMRGIDGERLQIAAHRGQVDGTGRRVAAVAATRDLQLGRGTARGIMNDMDDARKRRRSIHHRRRAAQDLDALDADEIERGRGRIEGAAPGHAIDDQQECIGLTQSPQRRHRPGRTSITARRAFHADDQRQRRAQVVGAALTQFRAGDDADRGRHLLDGLGIARRRDLHGVELLVVRLVGRRFGARAAGRQRMPGRSTTCQFLPRTHADADSLRIALNPRLDLPCTQYNQLIYCSGSRAGHQSPGNHMSTTNDATRKITGHGPGRCDRQPAGPPGCGFTSSPCRRISCAPT